MHFALTTPQDFAVTAVLASLEMDATVCLKVGAQKPSSGDLVSLFLYLVLFWTHTVVLASVSCSGSDSTL